MKRFMWGVLVCLLSAMAVILPACNNAGTVAVSFMQATTQAIDNGQTFNITATVKNDSSKKGVTWSLTGPGMLSNATTTSVTYSAPPLGAVAHIVAQKATTPAMVTATSVADTKKSNTVTISVTPPPGIANQTLAVGVEGTAYSQQVVETDGAGTLTWTIIAQPGPQPAGLNINSGTGVISGTPTGPNGTFTFTVKVTDSSTGSTGPQSAQAQVTITINLPPAPKISPAGSALPVGVEGTAYSQQFTVSNGLANFTWTVIGGDTNLPAGLHSAQSGTGNNTFTISGTPTGPNKTTNFQIKVTDSSNPTQSDTQSYSITINLPTPPKISPTGGALTAGTEGTPYNQPALTVNGGLANFTWTVVGGDTNLPAGLHSMQSPGGATFTISGTPTGPNTMTNFQIKVTDSSNPTQSDTQSYSITIALPPAPKISPASGALTAGTEGTPYNQPPLTVSGGLGNFTWTVVGGDASLPAGLHSAQSGTNNNTFTISGTPTGPNGTTNFQIKVTDSSNPTQSDTQNYSILVNPPPPPVISPASGALTSGNVGTPINQQFTVSGGLGPTFMWSETGTLPNGLSFNASNSTGTTVAITGTPTTAQNNVPFSVTVMDSSNPKQSKTNNYTLTINPPAPFSITTTTLPGGMFQQQYNATVNATGGIAPYTFMLDATSDPLPNNLIFASANNQATISGIPQTAGTFKIVVDAHDNQATPATDQRTYTLTITAPVLVFMPPNNAALPTGTQNQVYPGATISATGGVQPYTLTQDATSQLPMTGLTFTQGVNQATISGTPTQSGTFNVVIDFQDSEHPAVMQKLTYTLTINTGTVSGCPLPAGGNEALLNGTYAALFNAFSDGKGMFQAAASFSATGSSGTTNISSVMVDTNGVGQTPQNLSGTGCYSVGSDRRGTMIWNFGAGNTVTFAIAVRSNGNGGRVIEFDDSAPRATSGKTRGSGQFKKQTATAFTASTLNGNLAVGVRGSDSNRNRNGVGAVIAADGMSMITSGTADIEFASSTGTATFIPNATVTGMFTAPDPAHGRGTVTLNVTVPVLGVLTLHFAYYVIDTTQMFVQSTDTPDTVGHALQNGLMGKQSGGPFSIASLNGSAIFSLTGVDPSSNHAFTDTAIGLVASSGNGSFTGVLDQIVNAVATHNGDAITGTVSIGANGLGTLTITSPAGIPPFTIVMVAPNTALMLGGASGSPNNNVPVGILSTQTGGGSFTGTSVSGALIFGSDEPAIGHVEDDVGAITAASPNLTITQDSSSQNGLHSGQMQMATYTMTTNGRGIITLSAPNTGTAVIWLLQTNKAVILPQGQTNSAIFNVDQ